MPIIRADVGKSNSAERRYAAGALLSFPAPKAPAWRQGIFEPRAYLLKGFLKSTIQVDQHEFELTTTRK